MSEQDPSSGKPRKPPASDPGHPSAGVPRGQAGGKRHKNASLKIRIDPDLQEAAQQKAKDYGWSFGSVVRALLRLWTQEDVISAKDVGEESERAPKTRKKRASKK